MLGKYEWQVLEEMSKDEFLRWQALIEIEFEERKRAERLARSRAKRG